MANTYKNIVITPNISTAANVVPVIQFSGGNGTTNTDINLRVYTTQNGTLSFEGSAGQLFSITNDLTNSIFSVNDVSGIPSIEVLADGTIKLGEFGGNVAVGRSNANYKMDVVGTINVSSLLVGGINIVSTLATANSGTLVRSLQVLTAVSGTYTTPLNCTKIYAELVGGGGAGGGIATASTTAGSAGGGAGAYCAAYITVSSNTGYAYAVGAGGAGVSAAAGGNGGNTSLTVGATTYWANGGIGGLTTTNNGGLGGTALNGTINASGGGGGFGTNVGSISGHGGNSFFGAGGPATAGGGAGLNGSTGAGGSGASNAGAGANRAGGNGGTGLIRIWEFV